MFCAGDEDDSPKTPIVHPNDVLDIEVSPLVRSSFMPQTSPIRELRLQGVEFATYKTALTEAKYKTKRSVKATSLTPHRSKATAASMKRGDPFLPSVFSDENPIADFTIKKNSRKKPSDCKCKGFGYNLSPSAMLPEEMRQQWGVGVFGKHVAVRPSTGANVGGLHGSHPGSISCSNETEVARYSVAMLPSDNHSSGFSSGIVTPQNLIINNNSINNINNNNSNNKENGVYGSIRCMRCLQDICLCSDPGQIRDGFRIPDFNEKRKQKIVSKGAASKGKDTKGGPCGYIGNPFSSTPLKRSACFSTKEHSNIISTSNFPRNNPSPIHMPYPSYVYGSDPTGMASSPSLMKPGSVGKIYPTVTEALIMSKSNAVMSDDSLNLSRPPMPRRIVTNISPAPIISTASLDAAVPHSFHTPKKQLIPRSMVPSRRMFSQDCACDSCRRQSNLMSTMEAMGFSGPSPNQAMSPFLMSRPQSFQYSSAQPYPITSRYTPYRVPSYNFKSTLRDVYGSPERYERPSSPFYDYNEPSDLSCTPLTVGQDVSSLDTSSVYLETASSSVSPSSLHGGSWAVEDITDLSVQETVDFFINMKPPIRSVPSPQSDTSSDMYSPSPGEQRCSSPCLPSSSCFWSGSSGVNNWGSQHTLDSSYGKDRLPSLGDPARVKYSSFNNSHSSYPSNSMLYSSLVSDFEDELRCAIENIPSA